MRARFALLAFLVPLVTHAADPIVFPDPAPEPIVFPDPAPEPTAQAAPTSVTVVVNVPSPAPSPAPTPAPVTRADEADPNAEFYKDYMGVTKLLRMNGVDPLEVNWGKVEPLCLPLQTVRSNVKYNECRFAKAMDQVAFGYDSASCDDMARAAYPQQMLSAAPQATINTGYTGSAGVGGSSTVIVTAPAYTRDVAAGRRAVHDQCMSQKGWRNGRNWKLGRSISY